METKSITQKPQHLGNLKIHPEHYQYIKDLMQKKAAALGLDALSRYRNNLNALHLNKRVFDQEKAFRWDLLFASVNASWMYDNLYPYLDDSHIDSALRQIVDELNLVNTRSGQRMKIHLRDEILPMYNQAPAEA